MKIIKRFWQILFVNLLLIKYKLRYFLLDIQIKWYELSTPDLKEHVEKKDIKPIFIVGSGRSGNTLLARILHESGDACFAPENFTFWEVYYLYLKNLRKSWKIKVDLVIEKLLSQEDSFRWEKVDIDMLKQELYSSNEHTLGNIIDKWYLNYSKNIGYESKRWGCKTPNLTPYIHNFVKIFPNMKLLYIIRKPSDVVKSYLNTDIKNYNTLYSSIVMWLYRFKYMKKLQAKYKRIVFSDLINSTDEEKESVFKFCNIESMKYIEFENPDLNYKHMTNVKKDVGTTSMHTDLSVDLTWLDNIYYKEVSREKN